MNTPPTAATRQAREHSPGLQRLQNSIGYHFSDMSLLETALTHKSFIHEQNSGSKQHQTEHYERLEFLGDAVLQLVVSDQLYCSAPDREVGALTLARSRRVCTQTLACIGHGLELEAILRRGKGEQSKAAVHRPKLMADLVEALIGAVYLDSARTQSNGLKNAKAVVQRLYNELIPQDILETAASDLEYKNMLQEFAQKHLGCLPEFVLESSTGAEHNKCFTMRALLQGAPYGKGSAYSKKQAEQLAAHNTLIMLEQL